MKMQSMQTPQRAAFQSTKTIFMDSWYYFILPYVKAGHATWKYMKVTSLIP